MKVLITGAGGMLGSEVQSYLERNGHTVLGIDIRNVSDRVVHGDIRDLQVMRSFVFRFAPDAILHFAAETDVDFCERNPDEAFATNVEGSAILATMARRFDIPLLFVSSASVFGGKRQEAYLEDDPHAPINVYGATKSEAERIITRLASRHYILRASWMVGGWERDKKFVAKIISQVREGNPVRAVIDKRGSLTFTFDVAQRIIPLLASGAYGVYHFVNEGFATRFEIAQQIVHDLGAKDVISVLPVTSDLFSLQAPRPDSECLRDSRLQRRNIKPMPSWRTSLAWYVHRFSTTLEDGTKHFAEHSTSKRLS
jgi:dTDP-4-dehydrorhamnose reductase